MKPHETNEFLELLRRIESQKSVVLMRAVSMLLACCEKNSDRGCVLIVRAPADEENWALHVHSFNLDMDDTYIALLKAAHQLAEHIQEEAPPHEQLN
jgi:hypothetical protein